MRHVRHMPIREVLSAADRAAQGAQRPAILSDDIRRMADRAEDRAAERAGTEKRRPLDPDDKRIPF